MNDLISRRAAIKAIDDLPNCYNGYSDTYDKAYIIGVLEELPPIDTVPAKHGEWIKDDVGVHCSECFCGWDFFTGIPVEVYGFHYCPTCGAYMQERRNRE